MPRTSNKVERLMEAAKELIHQQGYNQTTLADIAQKSGVPLGNVYYYFKTKDEIAAAVIEEYRQAVLKVLSDVDANEPDPRQRLLWFIKRMSGHKDEVATHGCPVGSLCQELNKDATSLAKRADDIIKFEVKWAADQFKLMGRKDAMDLAVQLIATLQGVSLLANAMKSSGLIGKQLARLQEWIEEM
ncbi:MAG: TetR family transcriptional regulator [Betaproteobacteria bacterium]|nr:TetR family transcriptional regulator [Betaproteobacteria bacterium]